jgi:hypothetical protein
MVICAAVAAGERIVAIGVCVRDKNQFFASAGQSIFLLARFFSCAIGFVRLSQVWIPI